MARLPKPRQVGSTSIRRPSTRSVSTWPAATCRAAGVGDSTRPPAASWPPAIQSASTSSGPQPRRDHGGTASCQATASTWWDDRLSPSKSLRSASLCLSDGHGRCLFRAGSFVRRHRPREKRGPDRLLRPPTLAAPVRDKAAMAVAGPSDPVVTIIAALRTGMITATAGDESGVRLACR